MQGLAAISPSLSFLRRMFVAQQIASSNLLLLVTDATCDCSIFPPVLLDAKEVKYILLLCAFGLRAGEGGKPAPLAFPMGKSVECTACLWDSRRQGNGTVWWREQRCCWASCIHFCHSQPLVIPHRLLAPGGLPAHAPATCSWEAAALPQPTLLRPRPCRSTHRFAPRCCVLQLRLVSMPMSLTALHTTHR